MLVEGVRLTVGTEALFVDGPDTGQVAAAVAVQASSVLPH